MIFRVGAERSRRRSVHKVHDCDENREGNNPENSAVKGILRLESLIEKLTVLKKLLVTFIPLVDFHYNLKYHSPCP
ncbi:MAG: hypothetical protein U1E78_02940 [Gammaproteobacteria bacterium]